MYGTLKRNRCKMIAAFVFRLIQLAGFSSLLVLQVGSPDLNHNYWRIFYKLQRETKGMEDLILLHGNDKPSTSIVGLLVTATIGKKRALKKYDQFILNTSCFCTMCDFSQFWSHLCGTMHCLPQRLKATFFEIFSNGAAPKGPVE